MLLTGGHGGDGGAAAAYDALYRAYGPPRGRLVRLLMRMGCEREDACDIAQEALARLAVQPEGVPNPEAWATRTATNLYCRGAAICGCGRARCPPSPPWVVPPIRPLPWPTAWWSPWGWAASAAGLAAGQRAGAGPQRARPGGPAASRARPPSPRCPRSSSRRSPSVSPSVPIGSSGTSPSAPPDRPVRRGRAGLCRPRRARPSGSRPPRTSTYGRSGPAGRRPSVPCPDRPPSRAAQRRRWPSTPWPGTASRAASPPATAGRCGSSIPPPRPSGTSRSTGR